MDAIEQLVDSLDLNPKNISELFNVLASYNEKTLEAYQPALERLQKLVTLIQTSDVPSVSLEIANAHIFKEFNIVRNGVDQPYCILNIHDAALLVRINNDCSIDIYSNNLNKPADRRNLDDIWKKENKTADKDKKEAIFHYDFKTQDDCIAFVKSTIQTAAKCTAYETLHKYDVQKDASSNSLKKLRK